MEARFGLGEGEARLVDRLCAEFDPEPLIPSWMRERGDATGWEAYLRVERHELKEEVEVAALVGSMVRCSAGRPDRTWTLTSDKLWSLFFGLAQELTLQGNGDDYEAAISLQHHFRMEESDYLNARLHDNCEAACRRALFMSSKGPQAIAS
jgi:hypothetical protein